MGENGVGKFMLMKILLGVYQFDEGQILIDGVVVILLNFVVVQVLGIGIIYQELVLMLDLLVVQNIWIGCELCLFFGCIDEVWQNVDMVVLFYVMNICMDLCVLVGGLIIVCQQMVEIVKVLSYWLWVLIMDEFMVVLNDVEIVELFIIICKLCDEGVGIIYISYKMDEIWQILDWVMVMCDGVYVGMVEVVEMLILCIIQMMVGCELVEVVVIIFDLVGVQMVFEVCDLMCGIELCKISFQLKKGEILGFVGLMGVGCIELVCVIFGVEFVDSGEICINDWFVIICSLVDVVQVGIGYLFEDCKYYGLVFGMDVCVNIVMVSLLCYVDCMGWIDESCLGWIVCDYIDILLICMFGDW